MKDFYKISSILLALLLAFGLAACGDKDEDEPDYDNPIDPSLPIKEAYQEFYVNGCFKEKEPLTNYVLYLDSIYTITTRDDGNRQYKRRFQETWTKMPKILYHSQPYTDGLAYYYQTYGKTEVEYQGDSDNTVVQTYACISVKDYYGTTLHTREVVIQSQRMSECDLFTNVHYVTVLVNGDVQQGFGASMARDYYTLSELSFFFYKTGTSFNNPFAENNGSGGGSGGGGGTQDTSWEKTIRAQYHWVGDAYATSGLSDFNHDVTVRYDANTGKYYLYEPYFNPNSNGGKGLRFDAQKGYNSIRVWAHNYGPDAYGTYHLCECYCRFTID